MANKRTVKIKTLMLASNFLAFVVFAVVIGLLVNSFFHRHALTEAQQKSQILLQQNLAIHRYFAEYIRPAVLPLAKDQLEQGYFDPAWMSSTFAVRNIQRTTDQTLTTDYYYKECAINARSPQNEADALEKDFLQRLNRNPQLQEESMIREIDGQSYFVTLQRGEQLQKDCLLCHSTPEGAPRGLVDLYGDQRSFHRQAGETISAVSIRIPLEQAYAATAGFSGGLISVLVVAAGLLLLFNYWLYSRWLVNPILAIRGHARRIAEDERALGESLPPVPGYELGQLADAFNAMSTQLHASHNQLEERVQKRTEQLKKALHDQQQSEERYRTLIASMVQPMAHHQIICDPAGTPVDYRFIDVNPAFEQLLGRSAEEILGHTVKELLPETEDYWIENYGKVALSGEPCHFENYSRQLDRHFYVVAFSPKREEFAVVVTDITERIKMQAEQRKMEEHMFQVQKLESLGVLAGGIAHDFNNLLSSVVGHADLAMLRLAKESPALDNLKQIQAAARRATDLAKQMLAYSGKGRFVVEALNLNRTIDEMVHLLEVSISKTAHLRCDLSQKIPTIDADATQIRQVLMNLVINASEAIGDDSGTIRISTGVMDCDRTYLQTVYLNDQLAAGRYVFFEVSDTGCGMDRKVLGSLFDPFFTTKDTGRGLGMAAILGIVRGHKGTIKVYSEVNKGTTFKILLPASDRPETPEQPSPVESVWRGTGTILLVDDDEDVRAIGKEMIEELGYTVIMAGDGQEAIDTYKEHSADIDCVLMDMTMPRMSGEEAFQRLRQLDDRLKIVIASGYNEQEVSQKFLGKGLSAFLQKPFRFSELREVLERVNL